jgi:uncharacterized SAM-binding protein YcdF (DUF218 family)
MFAEFSNRLRQFASWAVIVNLFVVPTWIWFAAGTRSIAWGVWGVVSIWAALNAVHLATRAFAGQCKRSLAVAIAVLALINLVFSLGAMGTGVLSERSDSRFNVCGENSTAYVRGLGELEPISMNAIAKCSHPASENGGRSSTPDCRAEKSGRSTRNTAAALRDVAEVLQTLGGKLLVVNEPKTADFILVLTGDRQIRMHEAFRLLRDGWAPRVVIMADPTWEIFSRNEAQLAREFVSSLPPELGNATDVVPLTADSTWDEAAEISKYMDTVGAHSALIVTSDYHTRRALSVFRRLLPEKEFGVCGAPDPAQFGMRWWQRRTWAKRALGEGTRLLWWCLVDRWRSKPINS